MENSRRLFFDIKNEIHDASGIETPSKWWWKKVGNVYYPNCLVSEEEYHNEVYNFIDNNRLPEGSLDEIDLDCFSGDLLDKRNFFMDLFYQLGMKTKEELEQEQLDLMNEIRAKSNVNMVNCVHCGEILLHKMLPIGVANKITCFSCRQDMDANDCPDYWYNGCV